MSKTPSNTEAWELWLESITGGHHPASLAKFASAVLARWGAPQQDGISADQEDQVLRERDDAEDFIDTLLDEVLGHERQEWSSAYGRAEALNDVRERITALHNPAVGKALDRLQSATAAPQQEAQASPARKFKIGDLVTKTKGSQWKGRVVGMYSTDLTPEGYAVESSTEIGSVQIYPAAALMAQETAG